MYIKGEKTNPFIVQLTVRVTVIVRCWIIQLWIKVVGVHDTNMVADPTCMHLHTSSLVDMAFGLGYTLTHLCNVREKDSPYWIFEDEVK